MDDALIAGMMGSAVLSATLTQGFRLWRAGHTADPVGERQAAGATWLLVVALAVAVSVVTSAGTSFGAVGDLVLLVPAGVAVGLHPRVATRWGVVAVVLVAASLGTVRSLLGSGAGGGAVALASGGLLGLLAATTAVDH